MIVQKKVRNRVDSQLLIRRIEGMLIESRIEFENAVLGEVKTLTPVVTGNLKRHWKSSVDIPEGGSDSVSLTRRLDQISYVYNDSGYATKRMQRDAFQVAIRMAKGF